MLGEAQANDKGKTSRDGGELVPAATDEPDMFNWGGPLLSIHSLDPLLLVIYTRTMTVGEGEGGGGQ